MKTIKTKALLAGIASVALFALMSFMPRPGGFSYTIHLNNKLVSEHFVGYKYETPTLNLSEQDMKGTLGVYFNECGQIGQGRKLSLRDANQKILKEWSFANSNSKTDPLEVALKDVTSKFSSGKLAIYYASERVTKPQVLAYLSTSVNNKSRASLK